MSSRISTLAFVLAAAAAPAAFAGTGAVWVGGEAGFREYPVQSQLTRDQVRQELQAFRANPVGADGGRFVGGEQGYVPHQHSYVVREGVKVHTGGFAATMGMRAASPYERTAPSVADQYRNGGPN